jgi:NTP pyrophosphatase (non-canonical NTP hydrolase)
MTLDDYQRAALRTANPVLDGADRLLDAAAGLAEEAGEVLAQVRKQRFQRRPLDADRLAEELGDALWCLATVAGASGIALGDVAGRNLEKLRRRHPGGFRAPQGPAWD